jgi:hypothetical protein
MGYIPRQKSIILLMVTGVKVTWMLSRFVYHIIGVGMMVLMGHAYLDTLTRNDLRPSTAASKTYSTKLEVFVMNDLEINIGMIGDDYIGIIKSPVATYSFEAIKGELEYNIRMDSNFSNHLMQDRYALDVGIYEMISVAFAQYCTELDECAKEREAANKHPTPNSDPNLN